MTTVLRTHVFHQLTNHEISDVGATDLWKAAQLEMLADAVVARARAIRRRDGPHDGPLQRGGLNHRVRLFLVGVDAAQHGSKEEFLDRARFLERLTDSERGYQEQAFDARLLHRRKKNRDG